ncbi:hypothetical protein LOD99_2627 [Oopsacas minuta]|uniref:Large ribosomal subunit protein uL30-like ferredoxin-like fold domain-containing protein n=1 Tax=Oopsacas minuta TaxID=111878 RepID=A0AAV7K0L5_9METZ|nr:hypothetical protein LOD99_2627 [Oopsacas minuta]
MAEIPKMLAVTLRNSAIRRPYWIKGIIKSLGLKKGPIYLLKNTEVTCGKLKHLSALVIVKHVTIRNYANPYGTSRLNERGELFLGDPLNLNPTLGNLTPEEHKKIQKED